MQKIPKKYIPYLCLVFMILFSWIEESFMEGQYNQYLYAAGNEMLRAFIRLSIVLVLFVLGYIGLSSLFNKWVIQLWVTLYAIVLITSGVRLFLSIFFHEKLSVNLWMFLNSFYSSALTPFPYIFLLFLYFIITKKNK